MAIWVERISGRVWSSWNSGVPHDSMNDALMGTHGQSEAITLSRSGSRVQSWAIRGNYLEKVGIESAIMGNPRQLP
jgi:hypothetical protein